MNKIPLHIHATIEMLLQPYGGLAAITPSLAPEKERKRFLTIAEAARRTGMSRTSLWRLSRAGKLPVAKMSAARNGKILVDVDAVDSLILGKMTTVPAEFGPVRKAGAK